MNDIVCMSMKDLAATEVLAGATAGLAVQREILASVDRQPMAVCCLDFTAVQYVTASFAREAVFGTRDGIRRAGLSTQIIISNASPTVTEEVLLVARALGSCVVHARGADPSKFSRPVVLGTLDQAQRETLSLVLRLGEATATDLATQNPEIKPTAWNNRLTSLVGRGVLSESRRDRHKVYRPVLKGLSYGS